MSKDVHQQQQNFKEKKKEKSTEPQSHAGFRRTKPNYVPSQDIRLSIAVNLLMQDRNHFRGMKVGWGWGKGCASKEKRDTQDNNNKKMEA